MTKQDESRTLVDARGEPSLRFRRYLTALVLAKMLLFGIALPLFEGPDEPFHLDRVRAFVAAPIEQGWHGRPLSPQVAASIQAAPCAADLQRAFGCDSFSGTDHWFNAARIAGDVPSATHGVANYQDHQPPAFYATAAIFLRGVGLAGDDAAIGRQVIALRMLGVLFVALGLLLCSRFLQPEIWATLGVLLLLPGAMESLVRVANDAPVFAWSAGFLTVLGAHAGRSTLESPPPRFGGLRRIGVWSLAAIGPLIKLTALPVVLFGAVVLLPVRRMDAVGVLAAGGLIFPIQALRGWSAGGTLEVSALTDRPFDFGLVELAIGVAHSAYTFVKTAFWLGGWSVFRPPFWLLLLGCVAGLAWAFTRAPRRPPIRRAAHLIAGLAAALGFIAFAIGKQRVFGVWGAVGGWYAWAWLPWLALLLQDLTRPADLASRSKRGLMVFLATFVLIANVVWLIEAARVYGGLL